MQHAMKNEMFPFCGCCSFSLVSLVVSPQHKSFDHADNCYKSLIVFFLLLFSLIVTQKFDRLYTFRAMKNEHLHLPVQLGHNHFIKLLGLHHFCPKKWGMRVGGSKKTQIIWKKTYCQSVAQHVMLNRCSWSYQYMLYHQNKDEGVCFICTK